MGKRKKKNRNLGPRRKRMRRPARLQVAVKWRSGYGGKNIVRGYARWFGVDLLCAMVELRMLGVAIDGEYEQQIRRTIAARAEARARWRAAKLAAKTNPPAIEWSDDWPSEWIPSDEDASFDENSILSRQPVVHESSEAGWSVFLHGTTLIWPPSPGSIEIGTR